MTYFYNQTDEPRPSYNPSHMRYLFPLCLTLSTLLFSSCGSTDSDPQAVLNEFLDALSKKDIATARQNATADSKSMLDLMELGMKMDSTSSNTGEYDRSQMTFEKPVIENDKATIRVRAAKSGETTTFTLRKEKEQWKVAFDKTSMMNMGMEKMKEMNQDQGENMAKAKDALRKINPDSLEKRIGNDMRKLDSVLELIPANP